LGFDLTPLLRRIVLIGEATLDAGYRARQEARFRPAHSFSGAGRG